MREIIGLYTHLTAGNND